MKNSFEQKILSQLQKLKEQLSQQEKHINVLEQKLNNPTYEFHSSLVGNEQSKIQPKNSQYTSWLKHAPIIALTIFSMGIGYWLLRISWHAPLYQSIPLAYATGLIAFGIIAQSKAMRILGYLSYISTLCFIIISYKCNHLLHPQTAITLHSLIISILVSLLFLFFVVHYRKKHLSDKEQRFLPKSLGIAMVITFFIEGATTIILYFDRVSGQPSFFMKPFIEYSRAYDTLIRTDITQFLLTIYYMLFAFIILMLGMRYKNTIFSLIGYIVVVLAGYSSWVVARNAQNPAYLAVISILGILLLGLGFYLYKRK